MRLCSCGHYCALICWLEALKDYRCIQVELLFAYLATVKMLEAGVKSNEASGNLSLKTYLYIKDSTFLFKESSISN